jgi:hypothetical protein
VSGVSFLLLMRIGCLVGGALPVFRERIDRFLCASRRGVRGMFHVKHPYHEQSRIRHEQ